MGWADEKTRRKPEDWRTHLLILGFGSLALLKSGQKDGSFVRVTADGNVWGTYALNEDRTVEISTAEPNRDCESFSSRMTGKTMPTECEAKSEA